MGIRNIGIQAKIDIEVGLSAFVDSDFANCWNKLIPDDINNANSRTGCITHCIVMQIVWSSKLKSRTSLSSTEAEHAALSTCLRDAIPIMNLVKDKSTKVMIKVNNPTIKCRLYDDNESCIKIDKAPILTHRAKRIALEYHHF